MLTAACEMAVARAICSNNPKRAREIAHAAMLIVCNTPIPPGTDTPSGQIKADPVLLYAFEHSQALSLQFDQMAGQWSAELDRLSAQAMLNDLRSGKTIELNDHTLMFDADLGLCTGTNPYGCDYFAGQLTLANIIRWREAMLTQGTLFGHAPQLPEDIAQPAGSSHDLERINTDLENICRQQTELLSMANLTFTADLTGILTREEQQESAWRDAATQYRNTLSFAAEYDSRRTDIEVYKNWDTGQFVVATSEQQAQARWQEKYASPMSDEVECVNAQTSFASIIPYTGTVQLTAEEAAIVDNAQAYGDFTLDMLWLLVEGLGWRPGNPVPEDHPGWIAVWAEECACVGYIDIVRDVLGMPEENYRWCNGADGHRYRMAPPGIARALQTLTAHPCHETTNSNL